MKKSLPLILIGSGIILILIIVFFVAKGMKGGTVPGSQEEANIPEIPASEWPVVLLIPTSNPKVAGSMGHWLDFKVQKINIAGAATMDYELIYTTGAGIQQGVPGTVKLDGTDVDRQLLLGSESSGKFRYDAGVEQGTMTLKFRDASGKMIGKLATDFHLQSEVTTLMSIDGKFTYELDRVAKGVFFVTMKTFADPAASIVVVSENGYSVFASDSKVHAGELGQ
ncbi:MAG: hypothetical protein NTZ07_03675 [Candidatus Woesebacteria bacterium]|nr:hypothetical protein [Candidatus Woesebacteria bacterium]